MALHAAELDIAKSLATALGGAWHADADEDTDHEEEGLLDRVEEGDGYHGRPPRRSSSLPIQRSPVRSESREDFQRPVHGKGSEAAAEVDGDDGGADTDSTGTQSPHPLELFEDRAALLRMLLEGLPPARRLGFQTNIANARTPADLEVVFKDFGEHLSSMPLPTSHLRASSLDLEQVKKDTAREVVVLDSKELSFACGSPADEPSLWHDELWRCLEQRVAATMLAPPPPPPTLSLPPAPAGHVRSGSGRVVRIGSGGGGGHGISLPSFSLGGSKAAQSLPSPPPPPQMLQPPATLPPPPPLPGAEFPPALPAVADEASGSCGGNGSNGGGDEAEEEERYASAAGAAEEMIEGEVEEAHSEGGGGGEVDEAAVAASFPNSSLSVGITNGGGCEGASGEGGSSSDGNGNGSKKKAAAGEGGDSSAAGGEVDDLQATELRRRAAAAAVTAGIFQAMSRTGAGGDAYFALVSLFCTENKLVTPARCNESPIRVDFTAGSAKTPAGGSSGRKSGFVGFGDGSSTPTSGGGGSSSGGGSGGGGNRRTSLVGWSWKRKMSGPGRVVVTVPSTFDIYLHDAHEAAVSGGEMHATHLVRVKAVVREEIWLADDGGAGGGAAPSQVDWPEAAAWAGSAAAVESFAAVGWGVSGLAQASASSASSGAAASAGPAAATANGLEAATADAAEASKVPPQNCGSAGAKGQMSRAAAADSTGRADEGFVSAFSAAASSDADAAVAKHRRDLFGCVSQDAPALLPAPGAFARRQNGLVAGTGRNSGDGGDASPSSIAAIDNAGNAERAAAGTDPAVPQTPRGAGSDTPPGSVTGSTLPAFGGSGGNPSAASTASSAGPAAAVGSGGDGAAGVVAAPEDGAVPVGPLGLAWSRRTIQVSLVERSYMDEMAAALSIRLTLRRGGSSLRRKRLVTA